MRHIKFFENFVIPINDKRVGAICFFEYHCLESHDSFDAELWYRSHQKVEILSIVEIGGGNTQEERANEGMPRVYQVKFLQDGFIGDAFEDELMDSEEEYFMDNPPERRK